MKKGDKVHFTKERIVPMNGIGGIDEFLEDDDEGICVTPNEEYLFVEEKDNKALIGAFAGDKVNWGNCYLTLTVPFDWIK